MSLITPALSTTFRAGGPENGLAPNWGQLSSPATSTGTGRRRSLALIVYCGMVVAAHVQARAIDCIGPPKAAQDSD